MSYVQFGVGERKLALPLSAVEAIERPGRFTALPFGKPWLRGLTAIRGAVVPVTDLGRFFGGAPAGMTPSARLLVTRTGGTRAALLVDRVGSISEASAMQDVEILDPERLIAEFAQFQESGVE